MNFLSDPLTMASLVSLLLGEKLRCCETSKCSEQDGPMYVFFGFLLSALWWKLGQLPKSVRLLPCSLPVLQWVFTFHVQVNKLLWLSHHADMTMMQHRMSNYWSSIASLSLIVTSTWCIYLSHCYHLTVTSFVTQRGQFYLLACMINLIRCLITFNYGSNSVE